MDKIVKSLNNRYLIAITVFLFLLSAVKMFAHKR